MEEARLLAYGLGLLFSLLLTGALWRTHHTLGRMFGTLAFAVAVNCLTFFLMLLSSEVLGSTPGWSGYLFTINAWLLALSSMALYIWFSVMRNGRSTDH